MGPKSDPAAAAVATAARLLAIAATWGGAWWLRFGALDGLLPVQGRTDVLPARYLQALPVAALAVLAAVRAAGADAPPVPGAPRAEPRRHLAAAAIATLLLFTLALLARDLFQYSRAFLAIHGLLLAAALPAADALAAALLARRAPAPVPVVHAGGAAACAALAAALAGRPGDPVRVLGRCGPEAEAAGGPPRLGPLEDAAGAAARLGARRVLVADDALGDPASAEMFRRLADGVLDVGLAWRLPRPPGFPPPDLVAAGEFALASYWESPLRGGGGAVKRAADVVLGAILLLAAAPILLLLAILVRCTSRGPALYAQERVGLDGRVFTMWKLRTMREGAEGDGEPVFAAPGDPRRTPLGALLRRFSLDELPQLWNVVRGDMSLVGPRPERPAFVERFRREHPGYMLRHSLRAGLTGWAQVHGLRGRSSIAERLAYDLDYARRWSLLLDLEILARTAGQVLSGKNAY
jgi:exopolysaccharide biosynthesis polyprenyl glycosylphosphotransferase